MIRDILLFFVTVALCAISYDVHDINVEHKIPKYNTWDTFIDALIQVESGGDSYAIGKSGDVGVLQIRPIMVEEANRILGIEKYTLDDRYSREKSIEIWNVVQDYHNPEHDIRRALEVHNKYAPKEYVVKVFAKYYELTAREAIAREPQAIAN